MSNTTNLNTGNYINATSNYNTSNADISTDIYEIANFIDEIRSNHITDMDATSLMVGIFGYISEIESQSIQDTLVSIAETINEAFPTRAKFSKNILAHAMNLAITSITAIPATMTVMLYLPLEDIEDNFDSVDPSTDIAKFILDKDMPIFIDEFEFHLDYDIILTRSKNINNEYVYTAIYDLFDNNTNRIKMQNPISDISNPYINTVIQTTVNDVNYIAFSVRIRQVSKYTRESSILTTSNLESKTITFDFTDQLVSFNVEIEESDGTTTILTPIYNGLLDYTVEDNEWCYYEYISKDTIRIIFSRDSYVPGLNSTVKINVWTSLGDDGNFTHTEVLRTSMTSDRFNNYNGMIMMIYPLMNGISNGGRDEKSIADLKKIIPREASSRGSIINTTDLNNFFNSINDDTNYIYFFKKRDNPFERLYYAYMITKKYDTVYPTNTLSLKLTQDDFIGFAGNNNLVIKPGTIFYYYDHGTEEDANYCSIDSPVLVEGLDEDEYPYPMVYNVDGNLVRVFHYICPMLITIDDDLVSSYLLTIMDEIKTFKFDSINTLSTLQFIATNMRWTRKFMYDDEDGRRQIYDMKYTMDIDMVQNNESEYTLIKQSTDANGIVTLSDCRIRVIMVLYADETDTNPYRYIEAEIVDYESVGKIYTFRFTLNTDDVMDLNNRINILGIYNTKPEAFQHKDTLEYSHGYLNKNTYARIYILADFSKYVGDIINNIKITEETAETILYGNDGKGNRTELEEIIPIRDDIVNKFLTNELYYENEDGSQITMVSIMKSHDDYMQHVFDYNGNEQATENMILRYIRNNKDSDFVQNTLLKDEDSLKVIESYNYVDLSTYTLCNVLSVDNGVNFYHDYSKIMTSTTNVSKVQETDENGNPLFKEIARTDSMGLEYIEYKPIYKINDSGTYYYNYTIQRIPMIRAEFLDTEASMQDFILSIEERRKYIEECLLLLEDTFGIDLKFVNTFGPSRRFYYNIPTSQNYDVKVITKSINVYSNLETEEVIGTIPFGTIVSIHKVNGLWGYITNPLEGWIRLADTNKCITYMDNVALILKFSMEVMSSADRAIVSSIVADIKNYIENIDSIIELHMPNIITLITNNYREQLKYFEFRGVNQYSSDCQHIYLDTTINADIPPEFLNVATDCDSNNTPRVDITTF